MGQPESGARRQQGERRKSSCSSNSRRRDDPVVVVSHRWGVVPSGHPDGSDGARGSHLCAFTGAFACGPCRVTTQTMGVGLLICVVGGAFVIGWVTGGSVQRLSLVPLHGWRFVLAAAAAFALGAAFSNVGGNVALVAGAAAAAVCLLAVLVRNAAIEGVPLLAAGVLLNTVVIAANGAMPVSLYAESRAGISADSLFDANDAVHEIAGAHTRFPHLGDVVPVPLPVHPETVSAGDILILAGVGLLIVAGMHRRDEDEEATS